MSFSSTRLRVHLLTIEDWNDTIPHASRKSESGVRGTILPAYKQTPPSSSGPGRGPLKAQTAVRVRLGAPFKKSHRFDGSFDYTCNFLPDRRCIHALVTKVSPLLQSFGKSPPLLLSRRCGSANWSGPCKSLPRGAPRNSAKPFGLMKRRKPGPDVLSFTTDKGWMTARRWQRAISSRISSGRQTVARSLQICRAGLSRSPSVIASRSSNFSPTLA
jgi:hypothetical protein